MKKQSVLSTLTICLLASIIPAVAQAEPPASFDLRNVDGHNYVTPVRSKSCSS